MKSIQRGTFTGKLDQDTDIPYIKQGDYTDALNVRPITDSTGSTQSMINILGNEYACAIGKVPMQNKVLAIALDGGLSSWVTFVFTDANGNNLNTPITVLTGTGTFAAVYSNVYTALSTGFAIDGITFSMSSIALTSTTGYLLVELQTKAGVSLNYTNYSAYNYPVAHSIPLEISTYKEAYDISVAGDLFAIGSYDLLGDLFVFTTSNIKEVSTVDITGITNVINGVVTTSVAHGLVNGQRVKITGVTPSTFNGIYVINTVNPTTFKLGNTVAIVGSYTSGGTVTSNYEGVGEIGVIQNIANTASTSVTPDFSYTRLVRSVGFNFSTKHQIDSYVERNSEKISIYWTDEYNFPRVLYYSGSTYVQDGVIASPVVINSLGEYDYDTIANETKLYLTQSPTVLSYNGQQQSGGSVKSGNWRYAYRFISSGGSETEWSDLSNVVPVFKSSTISSASSISGDDAGVTTTKVNSFIVSGILPNLFKYIEFAGVNYTSSGSQIGYIIRKELLESNTSIILNHTGLEDYTSLDLGTLNVRSLSYNTAKNITAIDNRLVLSNLTLTQIVDFSAWTKTWKHTLLKQSISTTSFAASLKVGEYNDPGNVYTSVGYMDNETYRFGAKFRLKDGSQTQTFWIDDIRFDTSSSNITTPFETSNRRIAGLPNYNLTNSANTTAYSTCVQFSDFGFDTAIDGVSARDLIDEIIIEREECVKEILATGMAAMSVYDPSAVAIQSLQSPGTNLFYNDYNGAVAVVYTGEYALCDGGILPNTGITELYSSSGAQLRTVFAFYSPDIFYGYISISNFQSANGDVILNYGNPNANRTTLTAHSSGVTWDGSYCEYSGYTNQTVTPTPIIIDQQQFFSLGERNEIAGSGGSRYSKSIVDYTGVYPPSSPRAEDSVWGYQGTPVLRCTSNLTNVSGNPDYGFYYVQYKRPIAYSSLDSNKYGNRSSGSYIPTGASLQVTSTTSSSITLDVYGGDVFTQKTYVKRRFALASDSLGFDKIGWGGASGFYSQNRSNTQLNRRYDNSYPTWFYPNTNLDAWVELNYLAASAPVNYNSGYTIANNINSDVAFDAASTNTTNYPVRIIYSDLKIQNGVVDGYRNFLPLNFKDLDLSFGEIVHSANGNGELLTWQPRKFQRQYFNTTGILQTSSNLNVLIGDGSVLSRDGQTLSVIGSKHKWGIIKGKSAQGNDSFYWINTELKKVMRFGYDGTISLADVRGMQSFFANNLTWVDYKDTPADGEGICGVWDDRFMECVWTIRAKRSFPEWNALTAYSAASYVSYDPVDEFNFSTFEQWGEIYESRTGVSNVGRTPELNPLYWSALSHTDNNYYNEYTIVYNEMRNGFSAFYSFLPKIYLKWKDTYFTQRPAQSSYSDSEVWIYIHNKGEYGKWYEYTSSAGTGMLLRNGHLEGVCNGNPDVVKWAEAIRFNTEKVPHYVDFTTKTDVSYLEEYEFSNREGCYDSPVKMAIDFNLPFLNNDSQTTRMYGKYLKVKLTFQALFYQRIFDFIVKFRDSVRMFNK